MPNVITQEQMKAASDFFMPEVELGTPVFYFPFHNLNAGRLGFVVEVSRTGRNVTIKAPSGATWDSVRHVEDPKLSWNSDHREGGSWDFTDEHKRLEKERHEIKARLDALEFSATKSTGRTKKTTK